MSIFKTYFDYLNWLDNDLEELIEDEYTDLDNTNNYDFKEYTTKVDEDEVPF